MSYLFTTPKRPDFGWIDNLKDYLHVNGQELVRIPVYFLRINLDTLIWGAPLELFCEIAMNIRANSSYPNTFYFGLTNGTLLYLPTQKALLKEVMNQAFHHLPKMQKGILQKRS